MIRPLAIARFYLTLWSRRIVATILRRHDHDVGPSFCSCGCPVIGCPPCGGYQPARKYRRRIRAANWEHALDSLGSLRD